MFNLPLLENLAPREFHGKWVILRLDLDVPIKDGKVFDDFRLKKCLPTIEFLRRGGARILIIGHLGRTRESLAPVAQWLGNLFPLELVSTPAEVRARARSAGAVFLLENLRRFPGETANDQSFAAELAGLGEIYVNEAFASSHRAHVSIVGLPAHLPSYVGLLFAEEVENLRRVFAPSRPFLVILGGAKFETKLPVVKKLLTLADQIFIYGALAHAFFKEAGYELGVSLVEHDTSLIRPFLAESKIILPVDVRVKNGNRVFIKRPDKLVSGDNILDVGLESIEKLLPSIGGSALILWNGPLGRFEQGWSGSTEAVARLIVGSNAVSIVGGGDTIAAIRSLNLLNQFDFVSTAGGAMLEFLATGTLPGLEALQIR